MSKERISVHAMRTEATRTKIVNSAYNLFIKQGFSEASIDGICRGAKVSRGAFYANFNDKADVFLTLYARQVEALRKQLQTDLDRESEAAAHAEIARKFYLDQAADQKWLLLLVEFRLYAIRQGKVRRRLAKLDEQTETEFLPLIKPAMEDPSRERRVPAETLNAASLGMLYGLTVESLFEPDHLDVQNVQTILRSFIDTFHPPKAPLGQQRDRYSDPAKTSSNPRLREPDLATTEAR